MSENSNSQSATPSTDSVLGRILIERGLVTPEEVQEAYALQKQRLDRSDAAELANQTLGDLLIETGVITRKQLDRVRPDIDDRQKRQIPGYQLVERLGAGAMATVYKAKQLSLDRMVAVKVLPRKFTMKPEFVRRFYEEGRAAAKLNHPNIVGALDVGEAADTHYFVMEYVEGKTVFDDVTKKGRYTEQEAIDIAIQVTSALEHAHAKGFIHRDVKPKNIMITKDGVAKLADMGLARAISDREAAEAEAGKAFGTPYYISPEQIRGEVDVDFRADIYSLGCTLYHMVTGRVPFDGPNPSAVMQMHLKQTAKPVDHIHPELSSGIAEVIEVAMAKDRAKRYANTSDLLDDLKAVRNGETPMQARHMFDLAKLAALQGPAREERQLQRIDDEPVAIQNPLFWLMIGGWTVSTLLLIVIVILILRG